MFRHGRHFKCAFFIFNPTTFTVSRYFIINISASNVLHVYVCVFGAVEDTVQLRFKRFDDDLYQYDEDR